jgi:hypothetical protein
MKVIFKLRIRVGMFVREEQWAAYWKPCLHGESFSTSILKIGRMKRKIFYI